MKIQNTEPSKYKASADFYLIFPPELLKEISHEIFNASPEKGGEVWERFKVPFQEVEKKFIALTLQRNKMANKKGFNSFFEYMLNLYNIPKNDYVNFERKIDKAINFYTDALIDFQTPKYFFSEFSIPCYICLLPNFPFKNIDEAENLVFGRYEILDKFRGKVKVGPGDNSSCFYKKETDTFEVTIDKYANYRHQITDLIHELAHVIIGIKSLKRGILPEERSAYVREKEATLVELDLLKQTSPNLHRAVLGQFLRVFWVLLFEIALYKNPTQDLSKLYAKTFNRCFKGAEQKKNRTYILNENIILRPLSLLPHAFVGVEIALRK